MNEPRPYRMVAIEWDLDPLIPDELPSDWEALNSPRIRQAEVTHFPIVRGTATDFGARSVASRMSKRSNVSHFYLSVSGPEVQVSVAAVKDRWWVMHDYDDKLRFYGIEAVLVEPIEIVGFQELGHGSYFPCPSQLAVSSAQVADIAARVALGHQDVAYTALSRGDGRLGEEWLATIDPTWGLE